MIEWNDLYEYIDCRVCRAITVTDATQQAPTVAPLYIYECDCYAPEDEYPIGTVILAASGEIEAMTVCGEKVGGSIVIKIRQLMDVYATGRRRIIWSNVQSWR